MAVPIHYHSQGAVLGDFPSLVRAVEESGFSFTSKPLGAMPDGTVVQRYFASLDGRRVELSQGCDYAASHGGLVAMCEVLVLTFIGTMTEREFPYYRYYFAPVEIRRYEDWLRHLGETRRERLEFRDYFCALFGEAVMQRFERAISADINSHNVTTGLKPYSAATR